MLEDYLLLIYNTDVWQQGDLITLFFWKSKCGSDPFFRKLQLKSFSLSWCFVTHRSHLVLPPSLHNLLLSFIQIFDQTEKVAVKHVGGGDLVHLISKFCGFTRRYDLRVKPTRSGFGLNLPNLTVRICLFVTIIFVLMLYLLI